MLHCQNHELAQPRPGEDDLRHHGAAEVDDEVDANDRHHRDQRVDQRVAENDQPFWEPFAPCRTHIVFPEHVEQRGARHAHDERGHDQPLRGHGEHEVIQPRGDRTVRAQVNHREPLAFHSECVQKEDAQVERRDGNAAKREHTPQVIRDAVPVERTDHAERDAEYHAEDHARCGQFQRVRQRHFKLIQHRDPVDHGIAQIKLRQIAHEHGVLPPQGLVQPHFLMQRLYGFLRRGVAEDHDSGIARCQAHNAEYNGRHDQYQQQGEQGAFDEIVDHMFSLGFQSGRPRCRA